MPNGKIIKQIANEIGVTRQAVYQKIKSSKLTVNHLQLYTFTVDSVKYYTSKGETLIKSLFSDKKSAKKATDSVDSFTALFTAQLTEKDRQLSEKDKQIAEKDTQIAALTAMLQNFQEQQTALVQTLATAQALAAADKQQLLLQAEQSENSESSNNDKKGFFRRIFKK